MKDVISKVGEVSKFMKPFSNKYKLAILCFLWDSEKNVSEIIECSTISQSQVSQYLWKMKLEWILQSEKRWKEVYYKILDKKALDLISFTKKLFTK